MEDVKAFLFARWMAINFSSKEMNSAPGYWWKGHLKHFNENVYPTYKRDRVIKETKDYLNPNNKY